MYLRVYANSIKHFLFTGWSWCLATFKLAVLISDRLYDMGLVICQKSAVGSQIYANISFCQIFDQQFIVISVPQANS